MNKTWRRTLATAGIALSLGFAASARAVEPGVYVALSEGWGVFGRAGIGRTKRVGSTTGRRLGTVTDPTLGAGLRYGLVSGWAFKLGAERYGKSKVNASYLALQHQF